jgi:hypothetical protein
LIQIKNKPFGKASVVVEIGDVVIDIFEVLKM